MSRYTGRGAQRRIQSQFGFVSVAALLCLGTSGELGAQEGQSAQQKGAVSLPAVQVDPARRPAAKKAQQKAPTKKAAPRPAPAVAVTAPSTATNYQVGTAGGTGRSTAPLLDTPQSVTVIPQQIIREQASSTVMDALRNVPGITFRAGEGGNQGDAPYIRGFDARNDIFRDGVRDPGWYTRDSFSVDSVEVLKGPSSFMFGRGSTGGVINLNTKFPIFGGAPVPYTSGMPVKAPFLASAPSADYVEWTTSAHTGPGVRSVLDANKQINENAAARIQVMGQRYDIPGRDHVEENRWGVAPSFTYKFNEQTRATFSYIYQHDDSIPDRGIPYTRESWSPQFAVRYPINVPRNTWYGILSGPTPDREVIDAHVATARVVHEFTNNIKVTNTTRYVNVDRLNRTTLLNPNNLPANPAGTTWTPTRQWNEFTNELLANNTDFTAKFNTGGLRHSVVAGFDVTREERTQVSRTAATSPAATSIYDPDPYRFGGTFNPPGVPTLSNATTIGAYVADQVKITDWFELLGGVRFDNFDAESGPQNGAIQSRTDKLWSWRVGAVFHPTSNSSIYVMRGTSFNPSAEFLTFGNNNPATVAPESNETTEVGVKVDVLNKRLSLTGAVFRTDKTNPRVADPNQNNLVVLDGLVRVQGIEVGAIGRVTDQWQVFVGYTHLHSEWIDSPIVGMIGKDLLNTPEHAFSLWTTYDVTQKWTVGGGAFYVDSVFGNAANTTAVPEYWRFDAMTSYKITGNILVQLNIYNITNEYYFAQVYNNWAVPGAGRSAALTVRGRW
jgi:catecholate siderophore receptor